MFRFRLEKVLRFKQRRTEQQARVLRRVRDELNDLLRRRRQLEDDARRYVDEAHRARLGGAGLDRWMRQTSRLAWLRDESEALVARIGAARRRVDEEREQLVELHREQEAFERLREQRRQQWREAEARRRRKEMDEVAGRLRRV